jgi:hypothetical protein
MFECRVPYCFLIRFSSFIPASPSRCPHIQGSTSGRPHSPRGHIKTIPWPLARNLLSWWQCTNFLRSLFVPLLPPVRSHSETKTSLCSNIGHSSVTRFKWYCWGPHLGLLNSCFPQTRLPGIRRTRFKGSHLNLYFHSEMPYDLITVIILSQKKTNCFIS